MAIQSLHSHSQHWSWSKVDSTNHFLPLNFSTPFSQESFGTQLLPITAYKPSRRLVTLQSTGSKDRKQSVTESFVGSKSCWPLGSRLSHSVDNLARGEHAALRRGKSLHNLLTLTQVRCCHLYSVRLRFLWLRPQWQLVTSSAIVVVVIGASAGYLSHARFHRIIELSVSWTEMFVFYSLYSRYQFTSKYLKNIIPVGSRNHLKTMFETRIVRI